MAPTTRLNGKNLWTSELEQLEQRLENMEELIAQTSSLDFGSKPESAVAPYRRGASESAPSAAPGGAGKGSGRGGCWRRHCG